MKAIKKIIIASLVAALCIIATACSYATTYDSESAAEAGSAAEITMDDIKATLDELQAAFPTGTSWGAPDIEGTYCYAAGDKDGSDIRALRSIDGTKPLQHTSMNYACGGFAAMVSDAIYGTEGRPFHEVENIEDAMPGDIIVIYTYKKELRHVCVLLTKPQANPIIDGKYDFQTADGNVKSQIVWGSERSIEGGFGIGKSQPGTRDYMRCFSRF